MAKQHMQHKRSGSCDLPLQQTDGLHIQHTRRASEAQLYHPKSKYASIRMLQEWKESRDILHARQEQEGGEVIKQLAAAGGAGASHVLARQDSFVPVSSPINAKVANKTEAFSIQQNQHLFEPDPVLLAGEAQIEKDMVAKYGADACFC